MISPYVNILLVADDSFSYLSYIKAIRAFVVFVPTILYLKAIFSAKIYENP